MTPRCRNCEADLSTLFADLGSSPLANAYPKLGADPSLEEFFPLRAWVCDSCLLVQLEEFEAPEQIFSDYAYLSSWSSSWLEHCRAYVDEIVPFLGLDEDTPVLEIASNDGYLLAYFKERGIPAVGVEPAENVAQVALDRGIDTRVAFFGSEFAKQLSEENTFRLVIANNVLAHVPDLHDFIEGIRIVLAPDGLITIEVPHLLHLIHRNEFDTIYHEHFSYFSLQVLCAIFQTHGLVVTDVEELTTHGGSLRVHVRHDGEPSSSVVKVLADERTNGLLDLPTYKAFNDGARRAKKDLMIGLTGWTSDGRSIAGYGAPAKAATLFNYCGIGRDHVEFTVDASPMKQGRSIPGTLIPIYAPSELAARRPDVVWILPWNLKKEVGEQLAYVRDWGGSLVVWDGTFRELN